MPNIENAKKNKIPQDNIRNAEATVIKVKYAGQRQVGFGFVSKATDFWKVIVELPGIEKPVAIKTKEKLGWGNSMAQDVGSIGKMFGKNKPINEGDKLNVVYDALKPKKCFLIEEINPEAPQNGQPH